jgi:hypothetical protein
MKVLKLDIKKVLALASDTEANSIADISPHSRATERCAVMRGAKRAEWCEERGAVTVRASGAVRAERCAVHGALCAVHGAMST